MKLQHEVARITKGRRKRFVCSINLLVCNMIQAHDAESSAVQRENAVCTFIKHSRYFHRPYNFTSIHSHAKKLYLHMVGIVDTVFSYESELIRCSFYKISPRKKEVACY